MRFVVVGAGAVGGVIGGRLHQAGHQVTLVARGDHLRAIEQNGLTLETLGVAEHLAIAVTGDPRSVDWSDEPVVLLAVKSQDTAGALDSISSVAPPSTAVVCMQNGVNNERQALRMFERTYGMYVLCLVTHIRLGVVEAHSAPVTGIVDLGLCAGGIDETAQEIAESLSAASFSSQALPDVMRWKYRKLLSNLGNAVEALCGSDARQGVLVQRIKEEGEDVLKAAGISVASKEEDVERRGDYLDLMTRNDSGWAGGSSWQSLQRGAGSIETDYLNGEICLLGRLHGVPTPANAVVQRLCTDLARSGGQAGSYRVKDILQVIGA
jgi:2-dehydropantoate 2-reductase